MATGQPAPGAIAPVHEQPKAMLSRLRLFAWVALAFNVVQVLTGHLGIFTIAGIVVSALALRVSPAGSRAAGRTHVAVPHDPPGVPAVSHAEP
jgi:hypothetical protein